jgi:hypothetical protein
MTVPERVEKLIQGGAGDSYCDECIQRSLKLPGLLQVRQITASFAFGGGFERRNGACSVCHEDKRVIRALT